ncbi:MAG TPA: single-stranded-DNA-specific exonuclease RecJ [Pseudogracilibacillus sp.]|nr:single-stranded-DNA-specific exonuclease RecJ [Pseudogracilibacillus sp.]
MLQQTAIWNQTNKQFNELEEDAVIQALLKERGLENAEKQAAFLQPSLSDLQSPNDLNQMDIANERIQKAADHGEYIVIYGDYDADGITSTAVLYKALVEIGCMCEFYIPNRFEEGYGLNKQAIQHLHDEGFTLLITVDNGIASVDEVAFAKSLGMDVIITDHHEVQGELPKADAIIHPKLSPHYHWQELAGVGVAFKLATRLLGELDKDLLDLVAIGTIADLVPLLEENRILAYYGLLELAQTKHIGLRKLIEHCKLEQPFNEETIGFRIAPRLNAVGRLANASEAVKLLVTDDEEEAEAIIRYMEDLNGERQQIVNKIVKEADEKIKALDDDGVIMLYDEGWHEGVLGIAASRIVNKYHRPTFMFTHKVDTNELKGSARSIPAFDLFENCIEVKQLFTAFGGHAQAAGMTLPLENLDEIEMYLNEQLFTQLDDTDFYKQIDVTASLSLNHLTESFVEKINAFAPFGMANPKPIFHIEGIPTQVRLIGQNQKHLKLQFKNDKSNIDAIGFSKGNAACFIGKNSPLHIVGQLQINEWNGNRTVQILIEDMAIFNHQVFDYRGRYARLPMEQIIDAYPTHVIMTNNKSNITFNHDNLLVADYDEIDHLHQIDVLYIYDLPENEDVLYTLLQRTLPKCIYLCYEVDSDLLFEQMPTRDDFKWLYGFFRQTEPNIATEKIKEIIQRQKWRKDKVIFMVQVLLELEFIQVMPNRMIELNGTPERRELSEAPAYQVRKKEQEMADVFYHTRFEDLSNKLLTIINKGEPEEEISYGL